MGIAGISTRKKARNIVAVTALAGVALGVLLCSPLSADAAVRDPASIDKSLQKIQELQDIQDALPPAAGNAPAEDGAAINTEGDEVVQWKDEDGQSGAPDVSDALPTDALVTAPVPALVTAPVAVRDPAAMPVVQPVSIIPAPLQPARRAAPVKNTGSFPLFKPVSVMRKAEKKSSAGTAPQIPTVMAAMPPAPQHLPMMVQSAEQASAFREAAQPQLEAGSYPVYSSKEATLSRQSVEMLSLIPPKGLPPKERIFRPHNPVEIKHMKASSVFTDDEADAGDNTAKDIISKDTVKNDLPGKDGKAAKKEEKVDTTIRRDKGLFVQVKKRDTSAFDNLETAREALEAGQMETAVSLYKRALEKEPANKQALFGLATSYQVSGQIEQARDLYIQLIKMDQNNWPALNNFLVLVSQEAPEDALKHLLSLQTTNPHFAPIPAQIGLIYLKQEKFPEAARYLSQAAVLDPQNMRYRYDLAVLLDHAGDTVSAVKLYEQVLEAGRQGKELPESPIKIQARLEDLAAQAVAEESPAGKAPESN